MCLTWAFTVLQALSSTLDRPGPLGARPPRRPSCEKHTRIAALHHQDTSSQPNCTSKHVFRTFSMRARYCPFARMILTWDFRIPCFTARAKNMQNSASLQNLRVFRRRMRGNPAEGSSGEGHHGEGTRKSPVGINRPGFMEVRPTGDTSKRHTARRRVEAERRTYSVILRTRPFSSHTAA